MVVEISKEQFDANAEKVRRYSDARLDTELGLYLERIPFIAGYELRGGG